MDSPSQLFPPLSQREYDTLKESIAEQGILIPIEFDAEGEIVDGHHRLKACQELGIEHYPKVVRSFASSQERDAHILTVNLTRRHLTPEQTAEVREKQRQLAGELRRQGKSQQETARIVGVDVRTIQRWEEKTSTNTTRSHWLTPDLRLSIPRDQHEVIARRAQAGESYSQIAADYKVTKQRIGKIVQMVKTRSQHPDPALTPPFPTKRYSCIVLDPPWPIAKIEREERPAQGPTLDYPTMSLEDIAHLPLPDLADPSGCHIYLWVTHRFLPTGLSLLETWGFHYQCLMTWVKPTGMTPFSWMYNTEHILFGRQGDLPLSRMGLKLSFEAPMERHSAKPEVFYQRVREASPGPRLEMFARLEREGFEGWGNELP